MSCKLLALVLALAALVGVVAWLVVGSYRPSSDGLAEEAIAMSDMRRYCQVSKVDCSALRIQKRLAPVRSDGKGHWEFVVRLGESGPRYMVAVTPGVESQVAPLDSR